MAKKNGTIEQAVAAVTLQFGKKGSEGRAATIPLSDIVVEKGFNARTLFPEDEHKALVRSIKASGIIQPPTVRPTKKEGKYSLVIGERRYRAAQAAGFEEIPVIIREDLKNEDVAAQLLALTTDTDESALPLTPREQGKRYLKLKKEHRLSNEDIAKGAGVSLRTVERAISLTDAPDDVAKLMDEKGISAVSALELTKSDKKERQKILDIIGDDITENSVKRAAKELASESVDASAGRVTGKKNNRNKGKERSAKIKVHRDKKTLSRVVEDICALLWLAYSGKDKGQKTSDSFYGLMGTAYGLLWQSGEFKERAIMPPIGPIADDDIESSNAEREARLEKFWKKVEYQAASYQRRVEKQAKESSDDADEESKDESGVLEEISA